MYKNLSVSTNLDSLVNKVTTRYPSLVKKKFVYVKIMIKKYYIPLRDHRIMTHFLTAENPSPSVLGVHSN